MNNLENYVLNNVSLYKNYIFIMVHIYTYHNYMNFITATVKHQKIKRRVCNSLILIFYHCFAHQPAS